MITTCEKCRNVLIIPPGIPVSIMRWLHCNCGHTQAAIGMPPVDRPAVPTGRRAFPWLPDFPPRH